MDKKTQFKLVFYGILGCIGIYILLYYQTVHWEDMFVAIGTVILALFTWKLAITETEESKQTRQIMIDEARRERRRLRLKEQLEGLYSPLMSFIDLIEYRYQHGYREGLIVPLMDSLRIKYEYLAEPDLKEILREYYNTNLGTLSDAEWQDLANGLRDAIGIGHSRLIDEYDELNKLLSNK